MTDAEQIANRPWLRVNQRVTSRTGALLTAVVCASSLAAQDWPQFRGPNASGLGEGSPPTTWNVETGENVRWKTDIAGLAHSSPIVWGERVFVATAKVA